MEKKETFWADAQLTEKLATIPRSEKSTVIRMALRQYFGITSGNKPAETITAEDARHVARELMNNLKANREKE